MEAQAAFGSEVPSAMNEASCTDREMEERGILRYVIGYS